MKVATLTELFRDQGLLVKRGRKRTNIKRKGARRLWALTGTINRFSKALGVHWATGKKILNSYRLLESTGNAPSYRLALPP